MHKITCLIGLTLGICLSLNAMTMPSETQNGQEGQGMMGPGMMGKGMMGGMVNVPEKLPAPKSAEWVQKLQEILVLERGSLTQYTADALKYKAVMPYMMVIPQEKNHIQLIEKLFKAYGLQAGEKSEAVVATNSLKEALDLSVKFEQDLISRYVWLVRNAEDTDSARVLNRNLLQSRMHLAMFEHVLSMDGNGMGPGMMDSGMMGPANK